MMRPPDQIWSYKDCLVKFDQDTIQGASRTAEPQARSWGRCWLPHLCSLPFCKCLKNDVFGQLRQARCHTR